MVLTRDLHSLLTVLQGSENRVTSPVDERTTETPEQAVHNTHARMAPASCAVPEFELAAHLSVFYLHELVVAGRHAAVLHESLQAEREGERGREGEERVRSRYDVVFTPLKW